MVDEHEQGDPQIEQTARSMGWRPLEEWTGDPDKWVDANEFVERGEQILPILRANNRDLRNNVLTLKQQNDKLAQELEATRTIVQGLEKHFTESLQRQLAEQRRQLRAELKNAVEDRDTDRELDIREQLDQLTEAEREAKAKQEANKAKLKTTPKTDPQPVVDPALTEWMEDHPWFGEDKKRTKAVVRAAEDLRDEGDTSTGIEFYNKALARAEGGGRNPPVDKVSSGNSRSNAASGARTFASLPPEAREACLADVENFVGEGKLFKTEKEWKDFYVKTYYGE